MKNWTLTPAVLLSLTAGLGIGQPLAAQPTIPSATNTAASGATTGEEQLSIAGAVYQLRQIGPIRSYDVEAGIVVHHRGGPLPQRLQSWIGRREDRTLVTSIAPRKHPQIVNLELPETLADAHVWLAVEQADGTQGLGAFALAGG